MNETTIPAVNAEIAKKADAADLENYHTKSEIAAITGSVAEGKTVVGLISDVEGKVTSLENGQVKTNKEAIETIKSTYVKTTVYDADKVVLEEAIAANTTKIGTDIAAAKTELQGYADEKAGAVQTNLTNHINAYNTKVQELVNEVDRLRTENYVLRQNIIYYHNFVKEHVNLKELYEKEGLLLND